MHISWQNVHYTKVAEPAVEAATVPVDLTDETMAAHRDKVLQLMREDGIDVLVVYGDREHGANFGYLTGFEPRFEEAVLVLHQDGSAYLMLGNEALRMASYSRLPVVAIHAPHFSLPNQPMDNEQPFVELLASAGIGPGASVGIVGWKCFTSKIADNTQTFDVPHFIVEAVRERIGASGNMRNACDLFIDPDRGARATVNANELAHYEFGASLASACVQRALNRIAPGVTEMEIASVLSAYGQPGNVQTICATGERFTNAVVAPRFKPVTIGDRFALTMGLRGGLSSRTGYAVAHTEELPDEARDYMERVAIPYYAAAATWYSTIRIGLFAGALYDAIESVIPKAEFGWKLNPGHLTASEEWMSSPCYPGSEIAIRSGMMFQMDIIVGVPGYGGANAEDGVAIADEALRAQLARDYPQVWARIEARRHYMQETLGIVLHPEVLPMSNLCGYYRPYLLDYERAFKLG